MNIRQYTEECERVLSSERRYKQKGSALMKLGLERKAKEDPILHLARLLGTEMDRRAA